MPRQIITHTVPDLPPGFAELEIIAMDPPPAANPGPGHDTPHHYQLHSPQPNPHLIHRISFQQGDPRHGWNGGTTLAFLAVALDFMAACQRGPFACVENASAMGHVALAMNALKERIQRRAREGTFQTLKTGDGETKAAP